MVRFFSIFLFAIFFFSLLFQGCTWNPTNTSENFRLPEGVLLLDSADYFQSINVPEQISMVDFFSPACDSCDAIDDTVKNIVTRYKDKVVFAKTNILQNPFLRDSLLIYFHPTFIFYNGNKEARRILGIHKGSSFSPILDSLLGAREIVMLDSLNFDKRTNVDGLVAMVDFFWPSCIHCQRMENVVVKLALRYKNKALIGKVNCQNQNDSLSNAYNIKYIPNFNFFINGKLARTMVGETDGDSLAFVIDSLLEEVAAQKRAAEYIY
jgi:thioredoxin-like negative regulator of GroEL